MSDLGVLLDGVGPPQRIIGAMDSGAETGHIRDRDDDSGNALGRHLGDVIEVVGKRCGELDGVGIAVVFLGCRTNEIEQLLRCAPGGEVAVA